MYFHITNFSFLFVFIWGQLEIHTRELKILSELLRISPDILELVLQLMQGKIKRVMFNSKWLSQLGVSTKALNQV